jgi:arsenate reductase
MIEDKRMRVVFVCVENSNRSQMAEAFARKHGADRFDVFSAGSKPSGQVNPRAKAFMAEIGYDLATHQSKSVDGLLGDFDVAVTMGCGDECPLLKARRREDWQIPDPKHVTDEEFRKIRDQIEARVKNLLHDLG